MINEFIVTVIDENTLQARAFDGTNNIVLEVNKSDSITKIFEKLESGRSELSLENEKLQEENERIQDENMNLQEENNHLKSTIEKLEEQYKQYAETKEDYQIGKKYERGDVFNYNGTLYTVVQPHTSQEDWVPGVKETENLYIKTVSTSSEHTDAVLQEFKQPTGGHDAYKPGDKVIYNDRVYESGIENNVWSPTDYPKGWKDLGSLEEYKN